MRDCSGECRIGRPIILNPRSGSIYRTTLAGEIMSTAKADVASMLAGLPEGSSYEDIQYHLYVLEKVKRGMERAETEGAIAHEEAKLRLGKWFSN
jgi:hypothetical protein